MPARQNVYASVKKSRCKLGCCGFHGNTSTSANRNISSSFNFTRSECAPKRSMFSPVTSAFLFSTGPQNGGSAKSQTLLRLSVDYNISSSCARSESKFLSTGKPGQCKQLREKHRGGGTQRTQLFWLQPSTNLVHPVFASRSLMEFCHATNEIQVQNICSEEHAQIETHRSIKSK